jgi:hypothetical protein
LGLLHGLCKFIAAKKYLPFQVGPNSVFAYPLNDEFLILGDLPGLLGGKLAQRPLAVKPCGALSLADHGAIAAPGPLSGVHRHARSYRVEHDVAQQLQKMAFAVDDDGFIAALKDVTCALVASIDALGEDTVEVTHAGGQVALDGLDYHVVVVSHLAPGVHGPVKPLATLGKDIEPQYSVCVNMVDFFTAIAPGSNVVDAAGDFDAQGAGHGWSLMRRVLSCKT